MVHADFTAGHVKGGEMVNSCSGTTLPPTGILSYAHNQPLLFYWNIVIKNIQLKTLITNHVYDEKVHDWFVEAVEECVLWCGGHRRHLYSKDGAQFSQDRRWSCCFCSEGYHKAWTQMAGGNCEPLCILMPAEHHTHVNTHFRVYTELSCWPSVSVLGQTTEIWYGFRSSSETKSGARLMRSWPLKDFGKAMTSLILGAPTMMDTNLSSPVQEEKQQLLGMHNMLFPYLLCATNIFLFVIN